MKSPLLQLLCLLITINAFCQSYAVQGTILGSNSEPLPFATISLDEGRRGTISNINGQFRLVLKSEDRQDSLRISYVGYETQFVAIAGAIGRHLEIVMEERQQQLKEVVIMTITADRILQNAFDNITENYYSDPYKSTGFYRLHSRKNDQYVHLSEAVFDLYRSKEPEKEDQFRLNAWRGVTDRREAHGIFLGHSPNGVFNMDEVNSQWFAKIFNKKKFLKEHWCTLEGEYIYNEKPAYLISFEQKDGVKDLGYTGQFYISKDDFAFLEMNYGLSPQSLKYYKFSFINRALMEVMGINAKALGEQTRIRYQKIEDRYYLNDVSISSDFKFWSKRNNFNFVLNLEGEYLVSEIELENVEKFEDADVLPNGKLIEHQNVPYDSLFWDDYTIVLPVTNFRKISSKIIENNAANRTKEEIEHKLNKFPKDPTTRIDSILTFYHKKGLFNGNALVTSGDGMILNKSYSYQDQQLESDSRFRIGSTSKTFTSMLILMLEKEGKLNLSDQISQYIPEYRHGNITIAQLLTHQSGIPNYLSKNEYLVDIYQSPYLVDELIHKFCSDSLEFSPGESFSYSNSGYVLLAKIAEVVDGEPFDKLLAEKIFKPLEMVNTSFGNGSVEPPIEGYYYDQPEVQYPIQNVIGAGGVVSTTGDLLKWSEALENGNLIDGSLVAKAMSPQAPYQDWKADYGYGWMIDKYMFEYSKKHKIVYHPGTDMAFYSMFLKQPDEKITIVLLSNTGDFPRFEITDLILEVLN